jgi:hypothetical protein
VNYLPRLAWNCDSPDFSLSGTWDYRREPPAPDIHANFSGKLG